MSLNSASVFVSRGLCFFSSLTVDTVNPGNSRHDNGQQQVCLQFMLKVHLYLRQWRATKNRFITISLDRYHI